MYLKKKKSNWFRFTYSCDHKIDCFVVSTAPVRSEIELHNHRYWDALATSLYASIMFDVNTVDKFINESRRALEYEPQTLVEIGDMNNAYSKIVESAREVRTYDLSLLFK